MTQYTAPLVGRVYPCRRYRVFLEKSMLGGGGHKGVLGPGHHLGRDAKADGGVTDIIGRTLPVWRARHFHALCHVLLHPRLLSPSNLQSIVREGSCTWLSEWAETCNNQRFYSYQIANIERKSLVYTCTICLKFKTNQHKFFVYYVLGSTPLLICIAFISCFCK